VKYLLDTNILSEMVKLKPHKSVAAWLESVPQEQLYISALTLAEIRKGIEKLQSGARRQKLLHWLETELAAWFHLHIIPVDSEVADKWGYLMAQTQRSLSAVDSLIAASAVTHNLTLVTRNVADFKGIPALEVLNPWDVL